MQRSREGCLLDNILWVHVLLGAVVHLLPAHRPVRGAGPGVVNGDDNFLHSLVLFQRNRGMVGCTGAPLLRLPLLVKPVSTALR